MKKILTSTIAGILFAGGVVGAKTFVSGEQKPDDPRPKEIQRAEEQWKNGNVTKNTEYTRTLSLDGEVVAEIPGLKFEKRSAYYYRKYLPPYAENNLPPKDQDKHIKPSDLITEEILEYRGMIYFENPNGKVLFSRSGDFFDHNREKVLDKYKQHLDGVEIKGIEKD